jgi:hypothetical protein
MNALQLGAVRQFSRGDVGRSSRRKEVNLFLAVNRYDQIGRAITD